MKRALLRASGLAALAIAAATTGAQAGCVTSDAPCQIDGGEYHLVLPAAPDTATSNVAAETGTGSPVPVVMFLHGAGSNGSNVLRNRALVNGILERGYAVLAPTGERRFGNGNGRSWTFFPGWEGRDETEFLSRVVADAADRFGTSETDVLLSGFSAGGFMVNYLACADPGRFAAYAPVAGGFWRPHPAGCTGPVQLFHTHGWSDATVPLEGRFLGGGRFQQGDIFAGLEIWRAANGCVDEKPDGYSRTGDFLRRKWGNCAPDAALEMALFPGGHTVPKGWSEMVLDWFEGLRIPD